MPFTARLRTTEAPSRIAKAVAVATAAFAFLPAVAQADTVTQGESLSLSPSTAGKVISDTAASGGQALKIFSNASASRSVSASQGSVRIAVRARGQQCSGAPQLVVYIDGTRRLSSTVSSTTYATYTADVNVAAGTHTVKAAFTNDYRTSSCDRNLYVDSVTLQAPAATATPTPVPTPVATPTPTPTTTAPTTPTLTPTSTSGTLLGQIKESMGTGTNWIEKPSNTGAIAWVADPLRPNGPKVLKFRVEKGWEWSGDAGRSPAHDRVEAKLGARYGTPSWAPVPNKSVYYERHGFLWPTDQAFPASGSQPHLSQTNEAPDYTNHYYGVRFVDSGVRFGKTWVGLSKDEWMSLRGKWVHAVTRFAYGTSDTTGTDQTTLYVNGVKYKTGPVNKRAQMGSASGTYRKLGIYRIRPTASGTNPHTVTMDYAWADNEGAALAFTNTFGQ